MCQSETALNNIHDMKNRESDEAHSDGCGVYLFIFELNTLFSIHNDDMFSSFIFFYLVNSNTELVPMAKGRSTMNGETPDTTQADPSSSASALNSLNVLALCLVKHKHS